MFVYCYGEECVDKLLECVMYIWSLCDFLNVVRVY